MAIIIKKAGNSIRAFSDKIGKDVTIERQEVGPSIEWVAEIEGARLGNSENPCGVGDEPLNALNDFIECISGKYITIGYGTPESKTYKVPILDFEVGV
jgi:hypothetical protein